nr:three-finger toxin [Helicops leopardinus]
MKTLLLSLLVVAFVYLDLGYTISCYTCSGLVCDTFENCPNAKACFKKTSRPFGGKITRGCAFNCTLPAARETIKYCAEDKCNGLSFK